MRKRIGILTMIIGLALFASGCAGVPANDNTPEDSVLSDVEDVAEEEPVVPEETSAVEEEAAPVETEEPVETEAPAEDTTQLIEAQEVEPEEAPEEEPAEEPEEEIDEGDNTIAREGNEAVAQTATNVRDYPSTEEGEIIDVVDKGDSVTVLSVDGSGWYYIETKSGLTGYVYGEYFN